MMTAGLVVLSCVFLAPPASAGGATTSDLQRQLDALVVAEGGPPGVIVTLRRGRHITTLRAGVADLETGRKPRATDHMRIASVSKAFSGAVALHLVADSKLKLSDTIRELLPDLPSKWSTVTLRQLLNHTSGLPDYTVSKGFNMQLKNDPQGYVSPATILSWVENDELVFTPGSDYAYSNTDNIVVGLMVERVTGQSYDQLLQRIVFTPLGLNRTSFPSDPSLPEPFIHGYELQPGSPPEDVSTAVSPSIAWAAGGVVSTPRELGTFMRGYLGARFFPPWLQRRQLRFVEGDSGPPGPGQNSAGLGIFRYRTECGDVYGHTGNFPGYVQFAAATRDGRGALTTSVNTDVPGGDLLLRLREMQETAVCLLLRPK